MFSMLKMILGVILTAFLTGGAYLGVIYQKITSRIEEFKTVRPSVFYGVFPPLVKEEVFTFSQLENFLNDVGLKERKGQGGLPVGEFVWEEQGSEKSSILIHRPSFEGAGHSFEALKIRIILKGTEASKFAVESFYRLDTAEPLDKLEFPPRGMSSFYAGRVRTQNPVILSEIPASMRYAAIAIEDTQFLDHPGISFRSIARALIQDLRAGKFVQGGSTITQQLMKNLFFSRRKSLVRKVQEALYALVTEWKYSKETILETYLNEVYLGQWSTHEIHGVEEGAKFYFNQSASELTLSQSATLAAIIQLPNAHDPHRAPERVIKRRNLVLEKMLEASFIEKDEFEAASKEPLGVVPPEKNLEDIGYFMDLVNLALPPSIRSRLTQEPLTVYTTLNPFLQATASRALKENLDRLIKGYASLLEKEKKGVRLQSALIAVDTKNCSVVALQGGSGYRQTQFNRVLTAKRQPGSLFKPFVFLTAFHQATFQEPFRAETKIDARPFEWIYDQQVWAPRNYEEDLTSEEVTAAEALQKSMNIPTARLAQKVGVGPLKDTIKKAGIQSDIPAYPSISLGSAEVTPFELAESFTTLSNLGEGCALRSVSEVFDENGNLIFEAPLKKEPRLDPESTYQTVKLLEGVFDSGTAQSAKGQEIELKGFAGKTGTTNDFVDAWFVGFSPEVLALVWVGYDDTEKVGLTGASAALPLWVNFMKQAQVFYQETEFKR